MSKKFIFSAVALMAFSFAGMANEIEEKKEEPNLSFKIKIKPCLAILVEAHNGFVGTGMDDALAWELAGLIYNDYVENGKCGSVY